MATVPEPTYAPHISSPLAERLGLRYLLYFLLIPFLGFVFPFVAERVPPLSHWSVTYGGSILDYAHGLSGVDADVVFFGDSTVMYGVDTPQLSRELGLKIINLPNTYGSLADTGDWVLREYLAHNKPPRLIVFETSPWNLDFHQMPINPAPYEGDEQVVRHASPGYFVRFALAHPLDMLYFPWRFYVTPVALTSLFNGRTVRVAQVVQGYTPNLLTRTLPHDCIFPDFEVAQMATGSVEELLRQYRSPGTRTIAYLSPIPACQNVDAIAGRQYSGLEIMPPVVVPPEDIADDPTHGHPTAASAPYTTELLVNVIHQALSD